MKFPSRILVLLSFDLTRDERMGAVFPIAMNVRKVNPAAELFWDIGVVPSTSTLGHISAIFDNLSINSCDTLICGVCDEEKSLPIYAYIRELCRLCGINIITAKELSDMAKETE